MNTWRPIVLQLAGSELPAILHEPASAQPTGVVIVVGGPQYRVGSHRQFLLLARRLSAAGFPCLRFDYRGMGDSPGHFQGFEHVGAYIRAAIDALIAHAPGVRRVLLWGLCDAASAALLYASSDPRVIGLVIANPWVRSPATEARARVRHYYLRRLFSADFWKKVLSGGWGPRGPPGGLGGLRAPPCREPPPAYGAAVLGGARGARPPPPLAPARGEP